MEENRAIKGIVIDAGHGGSDPGAVANGLQEKDFNLEAARYMYERFQQLGVPVTLIRQSDETIDPEERVRRILAAYGDDPNVIVISNHINSGGGEGAEVIYALRNNSDLARLVLENIGEEGQIMRKYYQRRLPENPMKDYYFIHRNTGTTQPILVEYGFIDNATDIGKIQSRLLDFAEGVVRGVAEYAGIPYRPPEGSEEEYYTVQLNDSLWSIANKFNTTVDNLRKWNDLTTDVLQVGQILRVKLPTPTPPEEEEYIVYTVQLNDSLYKIANRFNTTIQEIVELNNLTTTELSVGQQLLIPGPGIGEDNPSDNETLYTVQRGDSLWSIAQRFQTTVDAIKIANNLATNNLQIGQQLRIPNQNSSGGTPPPPSNNQTQYTVQSGDSLWNIARRFDTTVDAIKNANNLSSNMLQIGQVLIIPTSNTGTNYLTYTVKLNDSLYKIAQAYNTTVDELKRINNLTSNAHQIGQQLKVPA